MANALAPPSQNALAKGYRPQKYHGGKIGKKRIKFGKNGIKDEYGNIIRTDHSTPGDIFQDFFGGGLTRKELRDKRIRDAVAGQ
jgi:hypothetical protein